ncbi:hypothetical protein NGUA14_02708 [Salmonella enterica]|nr:hypothetical protein NGUA11_03729 [Salmonella enterica]GAR56740.1 hypothetical protein NGUA14_02708 [Salmonella enterica]GAR76948.1 hypothetical protein NGUA18_04875 [Salmonella enterica]GAS53589.1 hypothetical protein NGUA36_00857 [Salmonella enterica]
MFMHEKYLSDIFQWVKKRFPTQQPCQWLKRYVETIKAVIIGYMSLINIYYGNCGSYSSDTLNVMSLPLRSHFSLPVIHLQKTGVIIHDVNTFQLNPRL